MSKPLRPNPGLILAACSVCLEKTGGPLSLGFMSSVELGGEEKTESPPSASRVGRPRLPQGAHSGDPKQGAVQMLSSRNTTTVCYT